MTALYQWLLLLHVLATMVWVGGLAALAVLATHVLRGGDPGTVARFVGSLRVVGPFALAPASAVALGAGVWMVVDSPAWRFGDAWVVVGLSAFAGAFLVGAVFLSRAALAAERASARRRRRGRSPLRRWSWGIRLVLALLVVAAWDMVFKPGAVARATLPLGSRSTAARIAPACGSFGFRLGGSGSSGDDLRRGRRRGR